jgi:hypothetical protein
MPTGSASIAQAKHGKALGPRFSGAEMEGLRRTREVEYAPGRRVRFGRVVPYAMITSLIIGLANRAYLCLRSLEKENMVIWKLQCVKQK